MPVHILQAGRKGLGIGLYQAFVGHKAQVMIGANRQNVSLTPYLQHAAQARIRTVDRIGQNPGARHTRIKGRRDQITGKRRLGGKLNILGNLSLALNVIMICLVTYR